MAKISNFPYKAFCGFTVMMNVNFNIANSLLRHLRQRIEQLRPVFFLRIEEAVARHPACGITRGVACDPWPLLLPASDTAECCLHRRLLAQRFIMVGDSHP
jgi:hypothetical protein